MAKGFTFNSRHSSEFIITMKSMNRSLLPEIADHYIEIPSLDGTYFFPGTLKDRVIEIECSVAEANVQALRQKARQIAAWLYTRDRSRLVFDDEPGLFHLAKISNQIKLEQICALGRFVLQFNCMPYAFSTEQTEYTGQLKDRETLTVNNAGTASTPVIIEVQNPDRAGYKAYPALGSGICSDIRRSTLYYGFRISINGQESEYSGLISVGDVVTVDTDRLTVTLNGGNAAYALNSNYPKLLPGSNQITYRSDNGCSAAIKVMYRERWI